MVRVSIEVRSGAARLKVAVRTESTERAVEFASKRYPGDVRVKFLEGFSVKDPAAPAGIAA